MRKAAIISCCLALLAASCGVDDRRNYDEAERSAEKLSVGMTKDEVRAMLGEPSEIVTEERWFYRYPEVRLSGPPMAILSVTFEDGKVVGWLVK